MNNKDKFITGQLFINTGFDEDGMTFDVYLGEHMTIFHRKDYVWICPPYNKRSNYDDNFKEEVSYDENDHSSELRDFFWNNDNVLLCTSEADFNRKENNFSIALKQQHSDLGLYNKKNSTVEYAYYNRQIINKDAIFQISPSTKPSEIAKTLQKELGKDIITEEHITSIEQKERETQEANRENQQLQDTNKQTTLYDKKEEDAIKLDKERNTTKPTNVAINDKIQIKTTENTKDNSCNFCGINLNCCNFFGKKTK